MKGRDTNMENNFEDMVIRVDDFGRFRLIPVPKGEGQYFFIVSFDFDKTIDITEESLGTLNSAETRLFFIQECLKLLQGLSSEVFKKKADSPKSEDLNT